MDLSGYREQIYDIFAGPDTDVADQISRALDIGTECLDMPIGFYTRIDHGTQSIIQAVGGHPQIQAGEACPLEHAYCRRTMELESALAIQDVGSSTAVSDNAIQTFDLGAYIGAKILVNDEGHGTVCFADKDKRDDEFTDSENQFVELLARLVGQTLERQKYEEKLDERETQLDEREERYRAVLDASFDIVFRLDVDGKFTSLSDSISDLIGYEPEELLGLEYTSVLPSTESSETGQDAFGQVLNGQTVEEEYLPLEQKSGGVVFVDVRKTPIYDCTVPEAERSAADIVGVQGMARDVTDRYRRERLIEVLNRVLRHNVRNEMSVIGGYADILQHRLEGENASMAGKIIETTHRLSSLSETARKLQENLDREPELAAIDIVPIVRQITTQIKEQYTSASLTIDTPETAVTQSAPRINAAIWEVIDNAVKHAGGQAEVDIDVIHSDETVVIRVSDNGPGIPADEQAVLVAGKETPLVHGSGLGLWLVHWIVESVDGTLQTQNTDTGACVEMHI